MFLQFLKVTLINISVNIKMINHIKNLAFIKFIVMIVNKCTQGKILTAIKNKISQPWKIANLKGQIQQIILVILENKII